MSHGTSRDLGRLIGVVRVCTSVSDIVELDGRHFCWNLDAIASITIIIIAIASAKVITVAAFTLVTRICSES